MGIFQKLTEGLVGAMSKDPGTPLAPLENVQEQDPEERKLAAFVKDKINLLRQSNSRIVQEGVYLSNVAYLLGFSGVFYDTSYRQFRNVDPKRRLTRNRFKVNKILPSAQNKLARLTKSPPKYDVRPNSNTQEDKDSARLGLEILDNVFDKQRFTEKRQDLHMSSMQGGVSYVHIQWDPSLGKPMVDPNTNEFVGYEGDVRIDVLNCLEVFIDPLAKSIDDAEYVIKAKVRKLEYFKTKYPERGGAVKEEDAWLLSSMYDLRSNALTTVGISSASTTDQMKHSAIEIVYYEKRCKDYPNGRMIVMASGVLLEDKDLPIGQFDIVKFDDIMIGSRYNSEACITHARPIQDQYNLTREKMANWIKANLGGKYIAAKGHGLIQEAINNSDAEVVEYNPVPNASEPKAMDIPQIPPYAYKDLDKLDQEFDNIFGINEISRGIMPTAGMPASGMAFLQEQDETRIGVQASRNEIGYAKVGENILRYVGKYYEMPRMLKTSGEGLEYAVKEFMGKDLNDNFDVIVIPGSTVPNNKVLKRQDILNLYQMGLLGDPQDENLRAKVLDSMEFGDLSETWQEQSLDFAQVQLAIKAIENNEQPEFNEFDNHQVHLRKMNSYRKTDKFRALDPPKQQAFMHQMELHLTALTNLNNPEVAQNKMLAEASMKQMPQMLQENMQQLQQSHPGNMPSTDNLNNMAQQNAPQQF